MRILSRWVAVLTIVAAATLAGCGGSDSGGDTATTALTSDPPSVAVPAADGDEIKGTGYSFTVPAGWGIPEGTVPGTEATDTFAADLKNADAKFVSNVNVIAQAGAPDLNLDEVEDTLVDQLNAAVKNQSADASMADISVRDRVPVDGETAVHIGSTMTLNGNENFSEQYYIVRSGTMYVVTFSVPTDMSRDKRDDLAASVLQTWKWAS